MPYTPKRPPLDPCPVEAAVAVVAGKWKARVFLELAATPATFGALKRALAGVRQQVLAAQLAALERDGMISRSRVGPDSNAGSLYALTDEGRSLLPVMDALASWGMGRLRRRGLDWEPPAAMRSRPGAITR